MPDALNYILFNNPVSQGAWGLLNSTAKVLHLKPREVQIPSPPPVAKLQDIIGSDMMWLRLAGLSGAGAVTLGAWGSHRSFPEDPKKDLRTVFETANRYHFFHTIALLAVPFARRPAITGSLMTMGTMFFCGTCYYHSVTGDSRFNRLAPLGGITLIVAWLSFIL